MKTLVINSYAGSITIGAKQIGADIVASMEDDNFFLDVQKRNYPELRYVEHRSQWPSQDLSDTVVIGHPPCSGFSLANSSRAARGVNSNAFACTKDLLKYAMTNKAKVVAIESVMGALGGAWHVHQHFADAYGYNLYRIVENGIMFSPQWRERFWAVWVKRDVAPPVMSVTLQPRWQTVGEVLEGYEEGPPPGNLDLMLERQRAKLRDGFALSDSEMSYYFDAQDPPHPTISLDRLVWQQRLQELTSQDRWDIVREHVEGFNSSGMTYLGPDGYAPTVMAGSFWYYRGRTVSEDGYKRIAGFPVNYVFPESPKNYRKNMRTGLSKGVIPAIARWVLEIIGRHLGETGLNYQHDETGYQLKVEPNDIADFRIGKVAWQERAHITPRLRQDEEYHSSPKISYDIINGVDELTEEQRTALETAKNTIQVFITSEVEPAQRELMAHEAVASIERVLNPPPPPIEIKPVKARKVPIAREPQPEGIPREVTVRPTRHGSRELEAVTTDGLGQSRLERRRAQVVEIIKTLGAPTFDDAARTCMGIIPIQSASMNWHIRELIKGGQLRVRESV